MKSEIKTAFDAALVQDFIDQLNNRSRQANADLGSKLYDWLYHRARKRTVDLKGDVHYVLDFDEFKLASETDLGAKLEAEKLEISALAAVISVRVVNGGRVDVTAPGTHEQTLNRLAFGSTWYDGHPDLATFIVNTLSRSS